MKFLKLGTLAVMAILLSLPAVAKDTRHMVCAGYGVKKEGPDNYGIVFVIDNQRAPNGVDRTETVSTIWNGEHLSGNNSHDSNEFAKNGYVILLSSTDESRVYFEGSYKLVFGKKKAPKLRVVGQRWLTPGDMKTAEPVDTMLSCIDYSN